MSNKLINNINNMSNAELVGLAKNRYLPRNIQMAIAKVGYRIAHNYLAENAGLDSRVRDYLWSDECNRGYTVKAALLLSGHYNNEPKKYEELYERYPSAWTRSGWRMSEVFFGGYRWHGRNGSSTSSALLNRIYDERYNTKDRGGPDAHHHNHIHHWYGSSPRYQLERLAKHPNVDLKLAIKLSQSGIDIVQKLGFEQIVRLKKQEVQSNVSN